MERDHESAWMGQPSLDLEEDMINVKSNIIFIRVPRTASTSIGKAAFVGEGAHLTAGDTKTFMQRYIRGIYFKRMFKFAFVRNPWDRLVSGYFRTGIAPDCAETFSRFVEDTNIDKILHLGDLDGKRRTLDNVHKILMGEGLEKNTVSYLVPQHRYLCDSGDNIMVDFIGRYENLQEDWRKVCDRVGMYVDLQRLNVGKHRPYREYYTRSSTIDKVAKMYEKDIEMFNYELGGE